MLRPFQVLLVFGVCGVAFLMPSDLQRRSLTLGGSRGPAEGFLRLLGPVAMTAYKHVVNAEAEETHFGIEGLQFLKK